jgi:hypothetical protein
MTCWRARSFARCWLKALRRVCKVICRICSVRAWGSVHFTLDWLTGHHRSTAQCADTAKVGQAQLASKMRNNRNPDELIFAVTLHHRVVRQKKQFGPVANNEPDGKYRWFPKTIDRWDRPDD